MLAERVSFSSADAHGGTLSALRFLKVNQLFFREEMEELRATVEQTKESISRIEVSLSARLSLLERQFRHIGDNDLNVSPDEIGVKRTRETSGNQPLDIDKILKLEQLTKLYGSITICQIFSNQYNCT